MARRKIVFVIVEGPSDEEALGAVMTRLFDESSVYVKIMRCDITAEKGISSGNIVSKVGNMIRQYAKDNHFTKNDFIIKMLNYIISGGGFIAVSYKKLWKLLIDHDMKKKDLARVAEISNYTITKMSKGENTVETLGKICTALNCGVDDIMEFIPHKTK